MGVVGCAPDEAILCAGDPTGPGAKGHAALSSTQHPAEQRSAERPTAPC